MAKEEQNWEQAEVEQLEEEESTLLIRKSRNEDDGKTTEISAVVDVEVSNGVSDSNGHAIPSEMAVNGAKNEELITSGEGQKTEELDVVLENEHPEAINGEQKPEDDLVFFDKVEGVDSTPANSGGPAPKESDLPSHDFVVQNNYTSVTINKYGGDASQISFQERGTQERGTSYNSSKEIESAEDGLINGDDLEETDLDVEGVLQKQNTHDLYCPNCNSCITRRVILRKRKRGIRISDEEVKRTRVDFNLGAGLAQSPGDQNDAQLPAVDEDERDKGPDVFRCLSCFSFFIPNGNGFKLFRIFGRKNRDAVEQGSGIQTNVQRDVAGVRSSTIGDQSGEQSSLQADTSPARVSEGLAVTAGKNVTGDKLDTKAAETVDAIMEHFDAYTGHLKEPKTSKEIHVDHGSDISITTLPMRAQVTDGPISVSQHGGLKLLVSNPDERPIPNQTMQSGHVYPSEVSQHTITKTKFEVHTGESLIFENISVPNGAPLAHGKDTVITIDAQTEEGSSHTVQGTIYQTETSTTVIESAAQISVAGGQRTEARKETQIEVIKSIVYGGLAESITSLSVVSSAAGGGAGTLNILALGMASLIGGLFILFHNILELRSDRIEQVSNQVSDQINDENDRYKELLGRRQNFVLHAIVAILSYLVFGLVSPVVYGFSFRKSDDKELKLTVMAAVSLVCIVILAICRAYVRRPPKNYVKSVTTFFIMGLMVSGVSYAAGVLVERLLVKLGLFQENSVSNLLGPEMRLTGGSSGWAAF